MSNSSSKSKAFADSYEGCQVVANFMGLNVETVRKRAKAGKIPAKQNERGTWVFTHSELAAAGIAPFNGAGAAPVKPKANHTDVIFVLDRSGSMGGLEEAVRKSLSEQIEEIRKACGPSDHYTISVINFDDRIDRTVVCGSVQSLYDSQKALTGNLYQPPRGGTALWDAIADGIWIARSRDLGGSAFLISVITDGEENSSRATSLEGLRQDIKKLSDGGRHTFVYAGPAGSTVKALEMGIPIGNCTTWDQTVQGVRDLTGATRRSLGTYTESRSRGVMKSTSFYAQPVTADAAKFAGQIARKLDDVTSRVRVERVTATDPLKISDFAISKFGAFNKGELYYELTEGEKVQDYKGIVVQDKTKGQFFSGWDSAKQLLGIPDFRGTVNIRPGQLGDFKVFVQSTSLNRRLEPGTALVRLS